MRPFITSQVIYRLLVWMCHSRTMNNKINKFHEKALILIYNGRESAI